MIWDIWSLCSIRYTYVIMNVLKDTDFVQATKQYSDFDSLRFVKNSNMIPSPKWNIEGTVALVHRLSYSISHFERNMITEKRTILIRVGRFNPIKSKFELPSVSQLTLLNSLAKKKWNIFEKFVYVWMAEGLIYYMISKYQKIIHAWVSTGHFCKWYEN